MSGPVSVKKNVVEFNSNMCEGETVPVFLEIFLILSVNKYCALNIMGIA